MENATMGKVLVPAMIENLDDLFGVRRVDLPNPMSVESRCRMP